MNGRLHYNGFTLIFQEVMQEPESFYVKTAGISPCRLVQAAQSFHEQYFEYYLEFLLILLDHCLLSLQCNQRSIQKYLIQSGHK